MPNEYDIADDIKLVLIQFTSRTDVNSDFCVYLFDL